MSNSHVRTLTKQWANALPTTFIDTVNTSPDRPDTFCTLEYNAEFVEDDTYQNCVDSRIEEGTIDLVYMTPSGQGDSILASLETEAELFFRNKDPLDKLNLISRDITECFDDEGDRFRCVFGMNYRCIF